MAHDAAHLWIARESAVAHSLPWKQGGLPQRSLVWQVCGETRSAIVMVNPRWFGPGQSGPGRVRQLALAHTRPRCCDPLRLQAAIRELSRVMQAAQAPRPASTACAGLAGAR